jgi:A nuclease family of the HNH/ENDO VII superfamily with conserved AHH
MSGNRYFDDFRIPEDSPLLRHIDLEPGSYHAKWDASSKTLSLKKHHGKKVTELDVTLEQLMMILMTVQSQRDKFTSEELKVIEQIERKRSPSVAGGYQSHHVIPMEICERSKLVIRAKIHGFDEDKHPNRIPLPITFHRGSHPKYSSFVQGILEDEWSDLVKDGLDEDRESVLEILNGAIGYFRDQLEEMSTKGLCTINKMFPMYD